MSCSSSRTVTPVAEIDFADDDVGREINQLESMMAEKAAEIFHLCDLDGKGLLTKSDMRRLATELPLSTEQLENVFDSLDVARNGFLTSVEFANGFGKFLGLSGASCSTVDSTPIRLIVYETETDRRRNSLDVATSHERDDEDFEEFLRNLGACGLLDDDDTIKSMWLRLRHDVERPELLENFEDLLRRLASELSRSHMDYNALKMNYRKNNNAHNEEIGILYEEMETKLNAEKERLRNEEKLKERTLKAAMEKELEEKDQRLNELLMREKELERSLIELNAKELRNKQENMKLLREKEEIEERLSNLTASRLEETSKLHSQTQLDTEIRSLAAIQIAQWLELEKENLVRQMHSLRMTNQRIMDEQDEHNSLSLGADREEVSSSSKHLNVDASGDHSVTSDLSGDNSVTSEVSKDDILEAYDVIDSPSVSQQSRVWPSNYYGNNNQFVDERQQPIGANSTTDDNVDDKSRPGQPHGARLFKIVFVGDSGVGKSSFIHRFCSQTFRPSFSATIGVDFQVKSIAVDGQTVALQLWDTAGQERFRTFTKQYFRKADGILVVYDVTDTQSFKSVREWMDSIQGSVEDGTVIVLLGNKVDLVEESGVKRAVSAEEGDDLAAEYDALFFETSAKSGFNIYPAVETMTRVLRDREDTELQRSTLSALTLDSNDSNSPTNGLKKFCCS